MLLGICFLVAVVLGLTRMNHVYFVSTDGNDASNGSFLNPVRTIQRGYTLAHPGDTVLIFPGTYRESVSLNPKPNATKSVSLMGVRLGNRRVVIDGSEPSSTFTWTPCDASTCPDIADSVRTKTYVATLRGSKPPTLITETMQNNQELILPIARAPNFLVTDNNKAHEHWWIPDKNTGAPTTLFDTADDPGLEPGNFLTLPNLTGGRLFFIDGDGFCGAFEYVLSITAHDKLHGSIETNAPIGANMWGNRHPGVGSYAKYYIENAIGLLDTPGEWYYDPSEQKLYLYPLQPGSPADLSISIGARDSGITDSASHIRIKGITIKNINDQTYSERPTGGIVLNPAAQDIDDVVIKNVSLVNAGNGISGISDGNHAISHITMKHISITRTSKSAIVFSGSAAAIGNVHHITVSDSTVHDAGLPYNEPTINFIRVSHIRAFNNHIYNTASYGMHITGFEKQHETTHDILVSNNLIEHVCQNAAACAALKFFGGQFADAVVRDNTFRDNLGWSYCTEKRDTLKGYAVGLFISNAGGIRAVRNTSVNNSGAAFLAFTRQIPATHNSFEQNRAEGSNIGIGLQGSLGETDTDLYANSIRHDNSVISDNIITHNAIGLSLDPAHPEQVMIRRNLFFQNRVAATVEGKEYAFPSDIAAAFPFWQENSESLKIPALDQLFPIFSVQPRR